MLAADCHVVHPAARALLDLQHESMNFVGFVGTVEESNSGSLLHDVVQVDQQLIQELRSNPYILCYASM